MRSVRRIRRPLVALVALVSALAIGYGIRAADSGDAGSGNPSASPTSTRSVSRAGTVALSSLPPQVAATVRLIESGGPFPYPRDDGVVFHNAEHQLPGESEGYYREYTVPTPGSDDRDARRLVTGRDGGYWYTDNHYGSFRRVDVNR